jgi:F-type H+-transporting ATPase subunit epsilon
MALKLKIITPTGVTFEGEVDAVVVPAADGEIEILPGHLPLLTVLKPGMLVAKSRTGGESIAVDSGFARVSSDCVLILSDESLNLDEEDDEAMNEAMERAKRALADARHHRESMDPAEIEKLDAKVRYQMAKKLARRMR